MAAGANPVKIDFDYANGVKYIGWINCGISAFYSPCIPYWASKYVRSQECTVDDQRVHYKKGWINKSDKLIPLDRVQDINIGRGCCARMFNVATIEIQTAGSGSAAPEAVLIAPKDAEEVRKIIMEKRDRLVHSGAASAQGGGLDYHAVKTTQPGASPLMEADIKALKESVMRIEKHIEHAVNK
ncbi:hypothetical protein HDU76_013278 [Blyttiomyces sp. JEL0837]|nr:hypothetical protein HDU76_013278 [Blyttiomyces sp. JEL0837]